MAPTWMNPLGIDGPLPRYFQPGAYPNGFGTGNDPGQLIGSCPTYNCGGSLFRIGSNVYSGRCTQCGRQWDVDAFGNSQPLDADLTPPDKYKNSNIGPLPWT